MYFFSKCIHLMLYEKFRHKSMKSVSDKRWYMYIDVLYFKVDIIGFIRVFFHHVNVKHRFENTFCFVSKIVWRFARISRINYLLNHTPTDSSTNMFCRYVQRSISRIGHCSVQLKLFHNNKMIGVKLKPTRMEHSRNIQNVYFFVT